ncbi:hypothetical protein O6H91_19G049500 [Diphasiastrum complanatum]|uniref:Uncharacterized protein n=2 Tax=Diphasiastrum complanatum TaxID=34168 RepID=A0ACC2AV00_DIPCM|nr:hypothetical protein O6H91_19G049500 [Diphasiastrum complanatum]KAJ7521352.1 hypothetical protein O6H91_19G049500 [Diphasiastrum complanatum]
MKVNQKRSLEHGAGFPINLTKRFAKLTTTDVLFRTYLLFFGLRELKVDCSGYSHGVAVFMNPVSTKPARSSSVENQSVWKMWVNKSVCSQKQWCIVGLVLFFCCTLEVAGGLSSDGQALLAFKIALTSDPRSILQSWKESDLTPCNWTGILCMTLKDAGEPRVTSINLPRKQLSGPISAEIGRLTHLQRINLHGNQLSGPLPWQVFNATLLRIVYLFNNRLSGSLPPEIGKLSALQYLDAGNNKLMGHIPVSISNCAQLVKLILRNNVLVGKIPSGLGSNLTSLQELDLSSNLLEGIIPDDLGDLSSLRGTLNLSNNHLSGAIPDSLGKLPFNVSLDVKNNNLTGPIPLNGALSNQGPTAFLGNAGLCGLPLANSCPTESPSLPNLPTLGPLPRRPPSPPLLLQDTNKRGGLSSRTIAAVAIGDTFGIALMGLIFLYCYWRNSSCKTKNASDSDKSKAGYCCGHLTDELEAISEKSEQGELVHFENDPEFDLEDLLKASAYVLGKRGSGVVYKAVLDSGLIVVVRRLGEGGIRRHKEFEAEAKLIGRIRHPNIVDLLAYYWSMDEKLLVYEFINNGSLAAALHGLDQTFYLS